MKKITILSIVIALVLACAFGISVNAADNTSFKAGDTVVVTFNIKSTEAIAAGDYTISYDPAYLTYVEGSATPANGGERVKTSETAASVRALFDTQKNVTTITATFTAVKAGNTKVTLTPTLFTDENSKTIEGIAAQTVEVSVVSSEEEKNNVVLNDVENEVVDNEVVSNEVVNSNVSKNEVSSSSNDDKKTYDQTGANIAVIAVVALAVVLGSAIVIKRK